MLLKPRRIPRERLPIWRDMTIAAGFICSNGAIVCADTQHSDEQAKYQREKIFSLPDSSLVVTGAGNIDYVKMAFDKLCDEFKTSAVNQTDARAKVESVILEIHTEHLSLWKPESPLRPELTLIVAVQCRNKKIALIKTALSAALLVDSYTVVGSGQPMFEYWASYLYRPNLDIDVMSYLAFFMLREAKKASEFCGGYSLVRKMPSKDYKGPLVSRFLDENQILADFPDSVTRILSVVTDLSVPDQWVGDKLKEFSDHVLAIREAERQSKKMRESIRWKREESKE